ncbi:hypothetical protein KKA14_17260 [bacterium]|nr:hypothetical protein [bacterium]
MLSSLTTKKSVQKSKSEDSLKKGIILIKGKLFKQAVIELKTALAQSPETVSIELEKQFYRFEKEKNFEAALSVGLVLFKTKKDSVLANKLGNYSRQLNNYKQANNFYREALRIDKTNKEAFYNFAASLGKVERYDLDVKKLIERYITIDDYILPDYLDDPDFVQTIKLEFNHSRISDNEESAGSFSGRTNGVSDDSDYVELCRFMVNKIKNFPVTDITEEQKNNQNIGIFNFGIYALSRKDPETALDCFLKLKSDTIEFENLEMAIAIAMDLSGFTKDAIKTLQDSLEYDRYNRFKNVNLAFMYKKSGNRLLACKYNAIAASLLEKSIGLYHMSKVMQRADGHFKQGMLDKALMLYKIVALEKNSVQAWNMIGEIFLAKDKLSEAVTAFKEILKIDPESSLVQDKFLHVHKLYCNKADALFQEMRLSQAAVLYERAQNLVRIPETIDKLISVYRQLGKNKIVQDLIEEQQWALRQKQEEEKEARRLEFIKNGKHLLKEKSFDDAINNFEEAFQMKTDKDVFVYLAHIYKRLKRPRRLESLVGRWQMMLEHDERRKKADEQKNNSQDT